MDNNQRSRRQKSANGSPAQGPRRGLGSRIGLEKRGAPAPEQPTARQQAARPRQNAQRPPRPSQQINPQKPGYRPGAPQKQRRVTQAEIIRRRNRRRALGILGVLAVLAVGAFVSVNLLFKVTIFRVENMDRTTPADTRHLHGGGAADRAGRGGKLQPVRLLHCRKTQQLAQQFPYLEQVEVDIQLPATVIIKVQPAQERFACAYSGGWMVLSDSLKILRTDASQPDGLTLLNIALPDGFTPAVGAHITPKSYNSLLGAEQATAETAGLQASAADTLTELMENLQVNGLFDDTTALDVQDLSDIEFTYQNRVVVRLGSETNLPYKLRLAAAALADPERGLRTVTAACWTFPPSSQTAISAPTLRRRRPPRPRPGTRTHP